MFPAEVAVVSRDAALRAELAAHFARDRFRILEADSAAEGVRALTAEARARVLFVIFTEAPPADEVQALLDASELERLTVICALRTGEDFAAVARLMSLGLREVFPLVAAGAEGLGAFVMSSLLREQERRRLQHARERATLERDIATAMAVSGTRRDIIQAFLQGLLAMGATGAACWERGEQGATRIMECGARVERAPVTDLPPEQAHPVVAVLRDGASLWFETGTAARSAYPDFLPSAEQSYGCLSSAPGGEAQEAVTVAFPWLPDDAGRHALEHLCARWGEALRRAHAEAQFARERERERRLLSVVTHDLRAPLTTVIMSANLLREAVPSPQLKEAALRIGRAGGTAFHLVEDLLAFTQAQQGGLPMSWQECDVFALLATCVSDARLRSVKRRSIELELTSLDGTAWVDPVRIEQAVGNLLMNALSHSPEGSVIHVRGSSDAHALYMDVENRGARLSPARIAEIFEPLKKHSTSPERGSLGLGLFIVGKIMEAHGGQVWAETFEPEGVRFCLQVPRRSEKQGGRVALVSSAHARSSPASPEPVPAPVLEPAILELKAQFRAEALHHVLELWCEARGKDPMPHPLSMDRSRMLADLPDMVSAAVSVRTDGQPVFSWTCVGPRLERRLRGTLSSHLSAASWESLTQYDAYRRCYEQRKPSYDYLRLRGAQPFSFERLLLPMTRMRDHGPSDILGLIVFSEER